MNEEVHPSTEENLATVFASLNDWVSDSSLDGSVQAWRERLAKTQNM